MKPTVAPATAYGLELAGTLSVVGAAPGLAAALRGAVRVDRGAADGDGLALARLFEQRDERGRVAVSLDRSERGYRMEIAGLASFEIAADGGAVACRPLSGGPDWSWQRLLAGHALPMAALLQGLEVLHASGVVVDPTSRPRAIAIAAGSHGGKSSLSANLVLRGACLLTDDALAVEPGANGVLAHPGVGAASLRGPEVERLHVLGLGERLRVLGEHAGAVRVLFERHDRPVPLAAVYWPERAEGRVAFARLPPDPRRIMASTINLVFADPERLRRHFEVSAAIAERVPLFRIAVPPAVGAAELAAAIEAHAAG